MPPTGRPRNNFLINLLVVAVTMAVTMAVFYRWPQHIRLYLVIAFAVGIVGAIIEHFRRRKRESTM